MANTTHRQHHTSPTPTDSRQNRPRHQPLENPLAPAIHKQPRSNAQQKRPRSITNPDRILVPKQMNNSPNSSPLQFGRYSHLGKVSNPYCDTDSPVTWCLGTRSSALKRFLFAFSVSPVANFVKHGCRLLYSWGAQYLNIVAYGIELASLFSVHHRRKIWTRTRIKRQRKHQRDHPNPIPILRNAGQH